MTRTLGHLRSQNSNKIDYLWWEVHWHMQGQTQHFTCFLSQTTFTPGNRSDRFVSPTSSVLNPHSNLCAVLRLDHVWLFFSSPKCPGSVPHSSAQLTYRVINVLNLNYSGSRFPAQPIGQAVSRLGDVHTSYLYPPTTGVPGSTACQRFDLYITTTSRSRCPSWILSPPSAIPPP